MAPTAPEFDATHASNLMKRGITLLNENSPESLRESIECFDQAIAIRQALLTSEDDWMGYVLAASWMNRGDALTRLGSVDNLAEAVHCYDKALAVLDGIPTEENTLYRRRLGIAWMNRGLTLHGQGTATSLAEAVRSFDHGIEQLREIPDQQIALASAWANRANSLLQQEPSHIAEARKSAATAVATIAASEASDPTAAETGFKARHILCQAIARELSFTSADELPASALDEALEAAAQGLHLARVWEERGEPRFASFHTGLFRFGVVACQQFRPDRLVEFISTHLPETPASGSVSATENLLRHEAAVAALTATWHGSLREGFAPVNSPDFNRLLATFQSIRTREERLRASLC